MLGRRYCLPETSLSVLCSAYRGASEELSKFLWTSIAEVPFIWYSLPTHKYTSKSFILLDVPYCEKEECAQIRGNARLSPSTVLSQTVSPLALAHLSHLQAGMGMGSGAGRPVSGIDRVGSPLEVLRKSCKRRLPPVALPQCLPNTSKPGT